MYKCTIEMDGAHEDVDNLKKIFDSEKKVEDKRANWRLEAKDGKILFFVEAKDAVAMRATSNTIMKNLAVYEKVKKV